MHNNMTEQKFRPLDILRNSMLSNETVKGAENLALMYSFYPVMQTSWSKL